MTDLPYCTVFDENVLRIFFVRTSFYNKSNFVRVVIERVKDDFESQILFGLVLKEVS